MRVVLQEFSYDEAAAGLGCSRRTLARTLAVALDALTEIFLETGLMEPFGFVKWRHRVQKQEGPSAA